MANVICWYIKKKTQQLDVSFPKRKSFKLFFFGFKVQLNPQKLQPCILTSDFIVLHLYSTEKQNLKQYKNTVEKN